MKTSGSKRLLTLTALVLGVSLQLGIAQTPDPIAVVTTETDQPGYQPGNTVNITGNGFQPGETVLLQVARGDGTACPFSGHEPWPVVADETGGFLTAWLLCPHDPPNTTLQLSATGQSSGRTAAAAFLNGAAITAYVTTDQVDYRPGSTVFITGGGFDPGETVTLQVVHADGSGADDPAHQLWTAVADPNGAFQSSWNVGNDHLGASLQVLAFRGASDPAVQTAFTDNPDTPVVMFQTLKSFGNAEQSSDTPYANLIQGHDGALYGTTVSGGNAGGGTVFKLNPDGSGYTLIKSFAGVGGDGYRPYAALVQASDGALYGTTLYGGNAGYGTVFKLNPDGSGYTVLYSFTGTGGDGRKLYAALVQASDGALYGTTREGGSAGYGTVFRLNPDGTGYTVLYSFTGTGGDGRNPYAALVQASDGALYGTTWGGGSAGGGTVYKLNLDGSGYAVVKNFSSSYGYGSRPAAALVQASDGALYGTTYGGGSTDIGTVFKLNPDGSGYTVLKSFSGSDGGGYHPSAALVQGSDGALYGTTDGGSASWGTVFRLNTDGSGFTVLKSFSYSGSDGRGPCTALLQGSSGALYGTTHVGGSDGVGTLFKINPDGSGFSVLKSYSPSGGDGRSPTSALVRASDGTLYGTTVQGGNAGGGTVFMLNPDGTGYSVLHNFTGTGGEGGDGRAPYAALVQASDGALYGTTREGGSAGCGTVFKLNPDGSGYTVLRSFTGSGGDGRAPHAALVQASDSALYGTTYYGGITSSPYYGGRGTIYKINLDGSGYTVLQRFGSAYGDGRYSYAALVQGSDGALYGTTSLGGSADYGTLFKLNRDGSGFTVLKSYSFAGSDGDGPIAALIQASDGALYGTTYYGGSGDLGTLFRLNLDGSGYTVLKRFSRSDGTGYRPMSALVQASDAALYGTTYVGGSAGGGYGGGTVYKLNLDGSGYTVLKSFSGAGGDGSNPYGALVQTRDGVLYGTTQSGGAMNFGTIFRLDLGLPPINAAPVANCMDVVVPAGPDCTAAASIDAGSYDPDGDPITLTQSPAGPYPLGETGVTLTVTDNRGASSQCAATVTVVDTMPPVVGRITAPMEPVVVNTAIAMSATFTDNCGPQAAVWTWGDGSTSIGVIDPAAQSVSGEHVYVVPGVYTVTLTVTDQAELTGQQSFEYVVVYDPNGGFVTGGGWISSPPGAYILDPTLTGKATFGFVAKYLKGANVPSGNTEFQFKAGNLNFKSTAYEWLVVAGARAQFKGWGTINGEGNYGFMLTAIDGQVNGGGGADRFRIRIWDDAGGTKIYDNQHGTDDNTALGDNTIIQGGSIVIHKP